MDGLLTYKGAVYPWHCDQMGHMNVMWYVGKFDEATWHLLAAIGLTRDVLAANKRGMAAVEQNIQYKRELLSGDIIDVHSRILEIKDRVIRFTHTMSNANTGEVAAITVLTAVHLDIVARRACAFADDVKAKAAAMIAPA